MERHEYGQNEEGCRMQHLEFERGHPTDSSYSFVRVRQFDRFVRENTTVCELPVAKNQHQERACVQQDLVDPQVHSGIV